MWRLSLVVLLFTATCAVADGVSERANNAQYDLTRCAAFFGTTLRCLNKKSDAALRKKISGHLDHFLNVAGYVGSQIGMTEDAMLSRLKTESDDMENLIKGSCVNISSLLNRHMKRCSKIAENPISYVKRSLKK